MSSSARAGLGSLAPLWRLALAFLALAALVAVPFLLWGEQLDAALHQDWMVGWFSEHRGSAWLIAIGLLVSDLALPIPNSVVVAALGVLYGPFLGGLVGTTGTALSGLLGYALCRRFGRRLALRLLGDSDLRAGERLFAGNGGWIVATSRWLPILPEAIACMAGLARMRLRTFIIALTCGSAPFGFTVATLGHAGSDRPVLTLLVCALVPLPLWFVVRALLLPAARTQG